LKFGLIPPDADDDSLPVVLARGIGKGYVTVAMLKEILAKAYGKLEVDNKRGYIKKHLRHLVRYDKTHKVYYLTGTLKPKSNGQVAALRDVPSADRQQYGHFPETGLYYTLPGEEYAPEKSEVLAWLMSANPNLENLDDALREYARLRKKRRGSILEFRPDDEHGHNRTGKWFLKPTRKATSKTTSKAADPNADDNKPESAPSIPLAEEKSTLTEKFTLTDEMRDFISDLPWLVSGEFWRQVGAKFDMSLSKVLDVIRHQAKEEGLVVGYNTVDIRPANITGMEYCGKNAYERWKVEYEAKRQAEEAALAKALEVAREEARQRLREKAERERIELRN
jgi:hypothetical protein